MSFSKLYIHITCTDWRPPELLRAGHSDSTTTSASSTSTSCANCSWTTSSSCPQPSSPYMHSHGNCTAWTGHPTSLKHQWYWRTWELLAIILSLLYYITSLHCTFILSIIVTMHIHVAIYNMWEPQDLYTLNPTRRDCVTYTVPCIP